MIEEILEPENLAQAWQRVRANKGAPGIDGIHFSKWKGLWQISPNSNGSGLLDT